MLWSYSRLTAYESCPYSFYLKYLVKNNDLYLSEQNYYAEVGSFVHKILEMIFKEKLSVEEAPQYFADNFDNNVFYKTKDTTMDKTYEQCADYFAELDLDWMKQYVEIVGVELKSKFCIQGYRFIGYIDLLLRDKKDGKFIIVDHKSAQYPLKLDGKVKKSSEKTFNEYQHQMYLYSYAVKEKYGEFPKEIAWNHFKEGKYVLCDFDEKKCEESVKWALDTIHKIENDTEFEALENYFYCRNLCDFRNSCEYTG